MIRRKLKPREYAARLVAGEITIDDVPEGRRGWCVWHIEAVARQLRQSHTGNQSGANKRFGELKCGVTSDE